MFSHLWRREKEPEAEDADALEMLPMMTAWLGFGAKEGVVFVLAGSTGRE